MRLMSSAALGFGASLLAAPLFAQTSFVVAGGLAVPVGNTADAVKSGFNVTAGLGIKPPLAPVGLRVEGMWNEMDFKSGVPLFRPFAESAARVNPAQSAKATSPPSIQRTLADMGCSFDKLECGR